MPGVHSSYGHADGPVASSSTQTTPVSSPASSPRHIRPKGGAKFSRPRWSSPPRVLLVDDDVVYRMLSGRLLKVFGCTIDTADDGLGAVDVLKMNLGKYDLVFMDIMMPNLDGITATSLIRQFDEDTPIISVTSNSLPSEIVTYYRSGMNDVLPKPFTKDGVYQILEKHLVHLKNMHEMSAHSSPLPPLSVLTPPPSPHWAPHTDGGSGKENSEVDTFPKPSLTPSYPRPSLAPMSPDLAGPSYLPSSSSLSSGNNDATHISAISHSTYTSSLSASSPSHDLSYLVLPHSPQSPQSQTSTLDALPDASDDLHFSASDFSSHPSRSCAISTPSFRIQRGHGVKRSLDHGDADPADLEEREHKRGKVD